jgi:Ca-activated chloride channel family protein
MKFIWPELLWMLAAMPLFIAGYVAILRRKKKSALRYASLSIVREAMGRGAGVRRHIPPILLLIALGTLIVAAARPVGLVMLPSQHETIVLAMDVSGSMRATDVEPNRMVAAQNAAKAFVNDQPRTVRIGIVSFAATASVVQPPTENREDLIAAIDRFQLQRGTAIGSGIIVSLATLFPDAGIDVSALIYGKEAPTRPVPLGAAPKPEPAPFKPVPPGSYTSAAIILLTDGQRTAGPETLEAARMAAERGVRIFTVGIGTKSGETIGFEGWSMRVRLDEESLKRVAEMTHGEYFYAGTAAELKKIYAALNARFVMEKKQTEITALFAGAAAALVLVAALLSLLWFNRIV